MQPTTSGGARKRGTGNPVSCTADSGFRRKIECLPVAFDSVSHTQRKLSIPHKRLALIIVEDPNWVDFPTDHEWVQRRSASAWTKPWLRCRERLEMDSECGNERSVERVRCTQEGGVEKANDFFCHRRPQSLIAEGRPIVDKRDNVGSIKSSTAAGAVAMPPSLRLASTRKVLKGRRTRQFCDCGLTADWLHHDTGRRRSGRRRA